MTRDNPLDDQSLEADLADEAAWRHRYGDALHEPEAVSEFEARAAARKALAAAGTPAATTHRRSSLLAAAAAALVLVVGIGVTLSSKHNPSRPTSNAARSGTPTEAGLSPDSQANGQLDASPVTGQMEMGSTPKPANATPLLPDANRSSPTAEAANPQGADNTESEPAGPSATARRWPLCAGVSPVHDCLATP